MSLILNGVVWHNGGAIYYGVSRYAQADPRPPALP